MLRKYFFTIFLMFFSVGLTADDLQQTQLKQKLRVLTKDMLVLGFTYAYINNGSCESSWDMVKKKISQFTIIFPTTKKKIKNLISDTSYKFVKGVLNEV